MQGKREQENATSAAASTPGVCTLEYQLQPLLAQGNTTADDGFLISQHKLIPTSSQWKPLTAQNEIHEP
jgi:hypothetical protein